MPSLVPGTWRRCLLRGRAIVALLTIGLSGCSAAPSRNILGSYFPSWMVCALAGLVIALIVRKALSRTAIGKEIPAPALVFLAMATAATFALWLLWLA